MTQEYIRRVKEGDEEAFRWIYDHYWNRVYGFAKIYLTDGFEREEVTQKVFIRLWKRRKALDENKNIDGLLFRRHENKKLLRAGKHPKGASKRTKEQDITYRNTLGRILQTV